MSQKQGPVLSVVDYDSWNKGYMPPSEHILIDKLSYRGARVVMSTWLGGDKQLWVVLEGGTAMTNGQRKVLRHMVELWFEDETSSGGSASAPSNCVAPDSGNTGAPPEKKD